MTSLKERADQESLEELENLRDQRIIKNRYKYYTPNGKCEEFIEIVGSGESFVSLFSAGNGVGKTAANVNIIANIIWGKGSDWFDYPLFNKWPYPKRGRIVSDPTTITDTIIPELEKWFPAGRYTVTKKGKNYESEWRTDNGWVFHLMTYEQDVRNFEAATLGFNWFDEPPPAAIYIACIARLRKGGIMFIGATPLTGSAWMYDHIVTYQANDKTLKDQIKGQRTTLYADIEDNCIEHGIRGILKHSDIQQTLAEYDEDELQPRAHGKFQHLSGLVFKKWDRKIHVIEPFEITEKGYAVYAAWDTHPRNPDAMLWMAVDRKGNKFVIDEVYSLGKTSALVRKFKHKSAQYRVVEQILEPAAFIKDKRKEDEEEQSLADELYNKYDLDFTKGTKVRARSDRRIKDAIDFEKSGKEIIKASEIFFFNICTRMIYEMEHYQWDEWKGRTAEEKSRKEKPKDKDDHQVENLGRILVTEPQFTPMIPARKMTNIGVITDKEFDVFE